MDVVIVLNLNKYQNIFFNLMKQLNQYLTMRDAFKIEENECFLRFDDIDIMFCLSDKYIYIKTLLFNMTELSVDEAEQRLVNLLQVALVYTSKNKVSMILEDNMNVVLKQKVSCDINLLDFVCVVEDQIECAEVCKKSM